MDANGSIELNEETFFSQMGALVYDMLNLEVSVEKVQTFVKAMCSTYGMIDLKSTLEQLVENVSRAIVLSEEGSLALTSSSTTTSSSSLSRQRRYDLDTIISRRTSMDEEEDIKRNTPLQSLNVDCTKYNNQRGPVLNMNLKDNIIVCGTASGSILRWNLEDDVKVPVELVSNCKEPLTAIGFGVSSDEVIASSNDNTLRMWSMNAPVKKSMYNRLFSASTDTKSVHREFTGHKKPITALHVGKPLSSQAVVLFSASEDATVRIWHSDNSSEKSCLQHQASLSSLRVSSQQDVLLSASRDNIIHAWDVASCTKVGESRGHTSWIRDLQHCPSYFISASNDCTLKMWDVRKPTGCVATFKGHVGPVTSVVLGGCVDPNVVSGSTDGSIRIWDVRKIGKGSRSTLLGHKNGINAIQRDFSRIVSASDDNTLRIWDMHTGQCLCVCKGHKEAVECILMRESTIYSGSWDGDLRVWKHKT